MYNLLAFRQCLQVFIIQQTLSVQNSLKTLRLIENHLEEDLKQRVYYMVPNGPLWEGPVGAWDQSHRMIQVSRINTAGLPNRIITRIIRIM